MTLTQRRTHLLLWLALVPTLVVALLLIRMVQVTSQSPRLDPSGPTSPPAASASSGPASSTSSGGAHP